MWKSPWMLACLASLAGGVGCRTQVCADFEDAYADVAAKAAPCVEQVPLPPFDAERCERYHSACTDEDLRRLGVQVTCYGELPTCAPERKAAFLQGVTDCDNHVLSNACEAAIF